MHTHIFAVLKTSSGLLLGGSIGPNMLPPPG